MNFMKEFIVNLFKQFARVSLRILLGFIRIAQMEFRIIQKNTMRGKSNHIYLFNVDMHTSIIADLKEGLREFDVKLISWNISLGNRNFRKFFKIQDPVAGLVGKDWLELSSSDFNIFKKRYKRFLRTFDGFIVTFPPAFIELFIDQKKPILVVAGTRYESPYTARQMEWARLNRMIIEGVGSGQITLVANNRGDADYLEHFTSVTPQYVPSLCEYTSQNWQYRPGVRILVSKNLTLRERIQVESGLQWSAPAEEFGSPFKWSELHKVSEILVLPYNISTMTLFELSTSGVPISIPSVSFMKKLRGEDPGILSQLSFYQVRSLPISDLSITDPNRTDQDWVIDWWLERADFYDFELMPNVRVISNFSELAIPHPSISKMNDEAFKLLLKSRNEYFYQKRKDLIDGFISKVAETKIMP